MSNLSAFNFALSKVGAPNACRKSRSFIHKALGTCLKGLSCKLLSEHHTDFLKGVLQWLTRHVKFHKLSPSVRANVLDTFAISSFGSDVELSSHVLEAQSL